MSRHDCQKKFHLPFAGLSRLLETKRIELGNAFVPANKTAEKNREDLIFAKAMEGVRPLQQDRHLAAAGHVTSKKAKIYRLEEHEREVIQKLHGLVEKGDGFRVDLTPEYHETTARDTPRLLAERLHRGEFAIQDWIDLHGCTVKQATVKLNAFFRQATSQSKQGLLIVHGRGLRSKDQPVLKAMVLEWLTTGPWRKWVAAAASARLCDGGAGATYVLLRSKPGRRRKPVSGACRN